MSFKLSKENRTYFKGISKEFKIKLDMYYLCLMMGLAANNKSENPDAGELIDYWADKYSDYANYIIGLILFVEAKNIGIDNFTILLIEDFSDILILVENNVN